MLVWVFNETRCRKVSLFRIFFLALPETQKVVLHCVMNNVITLKFKLIGIKI